MTEGLTRRRLLTLGAGTASGLAVNSLLPASVHAALAAPAAPGGLDSLRHVVFLMQENRSFDHYFGALRGVRGFEDRNAVVLRDGHPVFSQPAGGRRVLPFGIREAGQHCTFTRAICATSSTRAGRTLSEELTAES